MCILIMSYTCGYRFDMRFCGCYREGKFMILDKEISEMNQYKLVSTNTRCTCISNNDVHIPVITHTLKSYE